MNSLKWMVVYTKPRAEKKVTERLTKKGFEVYCPLVKTIRQWSDRKKKVEVPILPSYVFIKLNEHQRWDVLKDPSILNFVFWLGQPAIIKDENLEEFKNFISTNQEGSSFKIEELEIGEKVQIQKGLMKGKSAQITAINNKRIELILPEINLKIVCTPENTLIRENLVI